MYPALKGQPSTFPSRMEGGRGRGAKARENNEPYFPLPRTPACPGNGNSGPSPPPPAQVGKIFPKIIPSPPDEKPNCTRDLLEKTERERENGAERGRADCRGNCPRGGGIFQSPGKDSLWEKVAAQLNFQTVCESTHL